MAIHDLRNVNYSTDKFQALLPVTHNPLLARLFIGRESAITLHSDDYEKITTKYDVIDEGSATPTVRAEETNTYNHYKFVKDKEIFKPRVRVGVINGVAGKADMTGLSGQALRMEMVNFDKALLAGEDGNTALLGFSADTLRATVSPSTLTPYNGSNFGALAEEARAMGELFRAKVDATSMAESGYAVIYGATLKAWLGVRNSNTDNLTLLDEFRAGLDMPLATIKVADRLLTGTALASANGITFAGANQFQADVAGDTRMPTVAVRPQENRDGFAYDVVHVMRGSVAVRPTVEGGLIGATVSFSGGGS